MLVTISGHISTLNQSNVAMNFVATEAYVGCLKIYTSGTHTADRTEYSKINSRGLVVITGMPMPHTL